MAGLAVCVLGVVRCANPELAGETGGVPSVQRDSSQQAVPVSEANPAGAVGKIANKRVRTELAPALPGASDLCKTGPRAPYSVPVFKGADGRPLKSKIYSVPGFGRTFPDLQEVHIVSARKLGVSPVENREEAEQRKGELVYVGSNPYYTMDSRMSYSIPYLVPRAGDLLQRISRNFLDSLAVKGIPLHTLIVTSVLRTENDVRRLRRFNGNASEESCHRFGTTFDICYNRYNTVSHPDGPERRAVRSDSLKWVLSEVLRDLREQELCYVKYEVKQGCFHITVR